MVTAYTTTKSDLSKAPPKYHEPVQGTVFHGDGREEALLRHLQSLDSLSQEATSQLSLQDRSQRVLDAIHDFGKGENRYLMSVGDTKGRQVEALVKEKKPKLVLELGTYVGYSAISFSRHVLELHPSAIYPAKWSETDSAGDRAGYISLEKSEVYATTARGAFELAGVDKAVKVITGSSTPNLKTLREKLNMPRPLKFDMVFLDHLKPLYTIDIKILEEEGLVGPTTFEQGTVLVADNVVKPGNPAYLSWVRACPAQKRAVIAKGALKSQPPATPNPPEAEWQDAFKNGPIGETRWAPEEAEGLTAVGDPSLIYTSEMLDGWDPYTGERDACEVSVCTGREE